MHHHFPWRTLSCPLVHCLAVARLWHFDLVSLPERESNCKVLHDATTYNYMHLYTSVCVCIFLPLQYSALAVVNLWIVSPLPRGFVNSVIMLLWEISPYIPVHLVHTLLALTLRPHFSTYSAPTPCKSETIPNRGKDTTGETNDKHTMHVQSCTYNKTHVMRFTMSGNVSAKPCNLSMEVIFGVTESTTFYHPRPPGHLLPPPLPQLPCQTNQWWNANTCSYLDITSFACI